jgi:GNAT superfamily N-acetyltransferase
LQVVRCVEALPASFGPLQATAKAEGYDFLDRLAGRSRDDAYLGDVDACVFAMFAGDAVIAIGAQTFDEYDPSPERRRIRHFYVHPDARRSGIGRTLAGALIHEALALAPLVALRATHEVSRAFWEAMGFSPVHHPTRTHELRR